MNIVYVLLGGGLGAVLRWYLSSSMQAAGGFPVGTLTVNLVGCFLIGVFAALLMETDIKWSLLLITGFLGGFTTFSSFGLDMYYMIQEGRYVPLFTYIALSNVLGLGFVILGHKLTLHWV